MSKKISTQQVAFLRFELERGDAKRKKVALQDLCALYRQGQFLSAEEVERFETIINGLVLQMDQDRKVVRWCLNALARFGRFKSSRPYVESALKTYAGDPEIEAAGVAALCHMYRGSVGDIEALQEIDPTVWKLAALQNTDPRKIELNGISIDIYKADPAILRLALITVGLNRDIENLFHPKHSNNAFVRHLGQHSDDVVQQYSVWAVIENRRLEFNDLGVPLDSIETLRPNVQSKLYELVARRDPDDRRRLEITESGALAAPDDAREGLAKGVRVSFYDGLEGVTLDWFDQEKVPGIRGHLAEHFARFAESCGPYEDKVMQINEAEPSLHGRLLLGAEGKSLYSRLKAVRTDDLLAGLDGVFDLGRAIREQVGKPLPERRILMLYASPLDSPRIRLEEEQREIKNRLKMLDRAKFDLKFSLFTATRTTDILTCVLNSEADVFHFSGHGESDGLVFETHDSRSRLVEGEVLAEHLRSIGRSLNCVVLNACFSDRLANAITPYVEVMVGCDATIDDDAAITFASAFYAAMASGRDYEECFKIATNDVATNHSKSEAIKYVIRRGAGTGAPA